MWNWFELNELFRAGCDKMALVKKQTYETDCRERQKRIDVGGSDDKNAILHRRSIDARVLRNSGFDDEFIRYLLDSRQFPIEALKRGGYNEDHFVYIEGQGKVVIRR